VKKLPQPEPQGFTGAVGNFKIEATTDKKELKANDALPTSSKLQEKVI